MFPGNLNSFLSVFCPGSFSLATHQGLQIDISATFPNRSHLFFFFSRPYPGFLGIILLLSSNKNAISEAFIYCFCVIADVYLYELNMSLLLGRSLLFALYLHMDVAITVVYVTFKSVTLV